MMGGFYLPVVPDISQVMLAAFTGLSCMCGAIALLARGVESLHNTHTTNVLRKMAASMTGTPPILTTTPTLSSDPTAVDESDASARDH
jgi:hypothetical protein